MCVQSVNVYFVWVCICMCLCVLCVRGCVCMYVRCLRKCLCVLLCACAVNACYVSVFLSACVLWPLLAVTPPLVFLTFRTSKLQSGKNFPPSTPHPIHNFHCSSPLSYTVLMSSESVIKMRHLSLWLIISYRCTSLDMCYCQRKLIQDVRCVVNLLGCSEKQ